MGWPPKAASFFDIIRERILLGENEGRYKGVCAYMHHLSVPIEDLKKRMVTKPILRLLHFERPFEVHIDASYFTIGGLVLEDGHLVAYKS